MTVPPSRPFGSRLAAAVEQRGPLCVGIDPHAGLLADWGLGDDAHGLGEFARIAAAGIAPYASVVKPQSAFFERHGSRGVAVLERLVADCRAAGALVLLDVKRGDIGSTSEAYADAYLDPTSPLAVDAVTVSPYLGFGSLDPFVTRAREHDAGLFVLAMTSNKEAAQFQGAVVVDPEDSDATRTVGETVLAELARLNADATPLGSFGAVVGATLPITEPGALFGINGPLLAPGYGAQGGTAADLRRIFGAAAPAVLPSTSRGVLRAGPDPTALAEAVRRSQDDVALLRG